MILLFYTSYSIVDYLQFESRINSLRHNEISRAEHIVQQEAQRALSIIETVRNDKRLEQRRQAKEWTESTVKMCTALVENSGFPASSGLARKLVVDTLRQARHTNGKGYFFATGLDGIEHLSSDKPEVEELNILDHRDADGRFIIREMIELIHNNGEGFIEYRWSKPGQTGSAFNKTAFIKLFKPFNWFIGTGLYQDDLEVSVQTEVLNLLDSQKFANDGYFFVATYDGVSLTNPAKGRNMIDVRDATGKPVVQEMIRLAKDGGGRLDYLMPQIDGIKSYPKVSYVYGIADWNWYVGAGINLDKVDDLIAKEREEMKSSFILKAYILLGLLMILSGAMALMFHRLSRRIQTELGRFETFFTRAAEGSPP